MMKKIISCLLVAALVFGFAACGTGSGSKAVIGEAPSDLVLPDKKAAILVAPESEYPEDYKTAKALEEKYPDNVVVEEYADSRTDEKGSDIIEKSEKLAADETIGALIYARATKYTYYAIVAAKEVNQDILTFAVEPEQMASEVESVSTGVLCANWGSYAEDMVDAAKEQGAEYFLEFDYDSHTSDNFLYAQIPPEIEEACEDAGIKYIFCKADNPDSTTDGAETFSTFVTDTIDSYLENGTINENTVVFSTDNTIQATIIESVNKNGLIYVGTSFPTAYNGIGEAYDVKYNGDMTAYVESLRSALAADTEGKGRFSVYDGCCLASLLQTAALYGAFDVLSGNVPAEDAPFALEDRVNDAATGVEGFAENFYHAASMMVECYTPGIEKLK